MNIWTRADARLDNLDTIISITGDAIGPLVLMADGRRQGVLWPSKTIGQVVL